MYKRTLIAKVMSKLSGTDGMQLYKFIEKHPECSEKIKEFEKLQDEKFKYLVKAQDVLRKSLFGPGEDKYTHWTNIFMHGDLNVGSTESRMNGFAKALKIYSPMLKGITSDKDEDNCFSDVKSEKEWQKICSEGYSFKEEKEIIMCIQEATIAFKNPSKKIRQVVQDAEIQHYMREKNDSFYYSLVEEFFDLSDLSPESLKIFKSWKKPKVKIRRHTKGTLVAKVKEKLKLAGPGAGVRVSLEGYIPYKIVKGVVKFTPTKVNAKFKSAYNTKESANGLKLVIEDISNKEKVSKFMDEVSGPSGVGEYHVTYEDMVYDPSYGEGKRQLTLSVGYSRAKYEVNDCFSVSLEICNDMYLDGTAEFMSAGVKSWQDIDSDSEED